jgi:pimeloyl-ACP methyl ester carboxylesterase
VAQAIRRLGLDAFDLMGTASDGATALGLALLEPTRVRALVLEAPTEGSDGDLERRLPDVATPTLVLLGTRDDASGAALGRTCKARIAGSHLVFVYDAGAAVGRDRPQAFAEVVADFLERREAFVISRARTVLHP